MQINQQVSLTQHSTMGLGGPAKYLCEVTSRTELTEALGWAQQQQVPTIMIGDGSNIVWRDEGFPGLVIVNRLLGYEAYKEDESNTYITIGAGENWDSVVERSVSAGLTGIEALSLIPGTAGATPVQNVGAYGQEISQTLATVEAYDAETAGFVNLQASDCGFGYRTSRFKTTDRGRFFITAITLHLTKGNPMPPFYASVQSYFDENGITEYTPEALRQAVIHIRSLKLPNPAIVRNNGSFFANPVVDEAVFKRLSHQYDPLPHWSAGEGKIKLSAAWMIEQIGFKDIHDPETGMATWPRQPLVLVNEKATSTAQLITFRQKILDAVQAKFGITLEQEPELLPITRP